MTVIPCWSPGIATEFQSSVRFLFSRCHSQVGMRQILTNLPSTFSENFSPFKKYVTSSKANS